MFIGSVDEMALGKRKMRGNERVRWEGEAYCFDRGDEPWGVSLEIESQLVEGVCDVLGLEPGKCFKVGLKCRNGLDAGVSGVVWTDGGSFEEGGVGWRRGMDDTVV